MKFKDKLKKYSNPDDLPILLWLLTQFRNSNAWHLSSIIVSVKWVGGNPIYIPTKYAKVLYTYRGELEN